MAANPFDFLSPVQRADLLAGRQRELEEIGYYLATAVEGQATHLALVGEPGCGKTSLMNVLALRAHDLDLLPVVVTLTGSVVESELEFWRSVFESLMACATEAGLYEGLEGDVFRTFRTIMATLEVPPELKYVIPDFAAFYAGARKSADALRPVPVPTIRRDLADARKEAREQGLCGLVWLFDEADLLAGTPSVLQGLIGAFVGLEGHLITLAGRPGLLERLGGAYEPMRRRFKQVSVARFEAPWQTRECLELRLKGAGLDPEAWLDAETADDVHSLTGGRPWEIQLYAHYMYREAESRGRHRLTLTPEVLDSVLSDLQARVEPRGLKLAGVRQLTEGELQALWDLTELGVAPLSDLARLRLADQAGPADEVRLAEAQKEFQALVDRFRGLGLLEVDEESGARQLAGDEFDRVYLKCAARAAGLKLHHVHAGYTELAEHWFRGEMGRRLGAETLEPALWLRRLPRRGPGQPEAEQIRDLERQLSDFWTWWACRGKTPAAAASFRVRLGYERPPRTHTFVRAVPPEGLEALRRCSEAALTELGPRLRILGLQVIAWEVVEKLTPDLGYFGRQFAGCDQTDLRETALAQAVFDTIRAHLRGNQDDALWCAEAAAALFPLESTVHSNLGYLLMNRSKNLDKAASCFSRAVELRRDPLPLHNLATVNALLGRSDLARGLYEEVLAHPRASEAEASCLNVLTEDAERLTLRETRQVPVAACSHLCLALLLALQGQREQASEHVAAAKAAALDDRVIQELAAHIVQAPAEPGGRDAAD